MAENLILAPDCHPDANRDIPAFRKPEALGFQRPADGAFVFAAAYRARWLYMLVIRIEGDFLDPLSAKLVTAAPGITEFESIPVLLDMAEQVSTELMAFADGLEAGMGAA